MKNTATLTGVRAVKGGKFQIEISQKVEKPTQGSNLLALMNEGDERFSQSKERKAWMTAEGAQIKALFGIDCSTIKEGFPLVCDIVAPEVKGDLLNIQVVETIVPNEYQKENVLSTAKQYVDKDGVTQYLRKGNNFIYSNSTIVAGEANNVFVGHNAKITEEQARALVGEVVAAAPIAAKAK